MNSKLFAAFLIVYVITASAVVAQSQDSMSGSQIIEEMQRRHFLDVSVYEELSMILTDSLGNRDIRNLRRYSKADDQGNLKYLLLLDTPVDIHGAALLADRSATGNQDILIYLPAYGESIHYVHRAGDDNTVLGMDFSLEDLSWELTTDYQYLRRENERVGDADYLVIDVFAAEVDSLTAVPLKRHFVHQQGYFLMRTEYFDKKGRLTRQQTLHDIRKHDNSRWSAGMIVMEDLRERHSTLIKINRRIVSADYVPDEVFSVRWLYQNQPPLQNEDSTDDVFNIDQDHDPQMAFIEHRPPEMFQKCIYPC